MEYENILSGITFNNSISKIPLKIISNESSVFTWQKKRLGFLKKNSLPISWADIGVILDDPYILIIRDLVEFPNKQLNGYIRIYNQAYLKGGAAGCVILPIKEKKILLIHNFRHATRSWHWEIPRGFGEPELTASELARMEMKEEVGLDIEELVDLGIVYNNTGLEGNPISVFLASVNDEPLINTGIGIDSIRWVDVGQLEEMINCGDITDGFTIVAYTRAKLKKII
jgi:ADP-ribose pyrophosphatase